MKRRMILQSMIACVALGAIVLAGGCRSMERDTAVCPKCERTVTSFHPKKGMSVKTVNCTSCKQAVTINDAGEVTGTTHYCDACGALVGTCPKCSKKM